MLARRIAAVVAALLAGAGASACGNTATTESRPEEPAAVARAAETRPATTELRAVTRAGAALRNVPAAFRLPSGSRVADVSDRRSGASFTLTAPDPEAVLSFYRRELPRAAFTILSDRAEDGATSLAFRDADGWAGAIFATAHRVTVAVKRA
ncbi:hypothetical protein [Actinoplanes sp. NPDC049265]|uniref:hypothetical protein n=1 Tax=Actinoplanes sp. NPDC049265 TaxID=3363902 RepID=UPI003711813F